MRIKIAFLPVVVALALSCRSSVTDAPKTIEASASGQSSPVVLDHKCGTCFFSAHLDSLAITARDMNVYKEVTATIASGMGCPCELSLCIDGFMPAKPFLSFLGNNEAGVTWRIPSQHTQPDIELSGVFWAAPYRANVITRQTGKEIIFIVILPHSGQ